MFKFVFSAVFCAALCLPGTVFAQDCGCCQPAPRKQLKLEQVDRQVSRLEMKCTTNECGCTSRKLARTCKTVQRPKLSLVDAPPADPCAGRSGLLSRLRGRVGNIGGAGGGDCGCSAAPAPAPCGCSAAPEPAPCGCDGGGAISYDEGAMSFEGAPMMGIDSSSAVQGAASAAISEAIDQ